MEDTLLLGVSQDQFLVQTALDYLDRGLCVIPIAPGTKKPPRRFRLKRYFTGPPPAARVRKWWSETYRGHGIAAIVGGVSDHLCVRDYDVQESYDTWAADHPRLAATLPTVVTHRGAHVYFKCDTAEIYRDYGACIKCGDGEAKISEGYVVMPPTLHELTGLPYEWLVEPTDIPYVSDPVLAGLLPAVPDKNRIMDDWTQGCGGESTEGGQSALMDSSLPGIAGAEEIDLSNLTVEQAVLASQPSGYGQRHAKIFFLCRLLKSIPETRHKSAAELHPVLEDWFSLSRPNVRTKDFSETWKDFLYDWRHVERPFRLDSASRTLPPLSYFAARATGNGRDFLDSLCLELQNYTPDRSFFLGCRAAADIVGVSKSTISLWMRQLIINGRLWPTRPFGNFSYKDDQAATYYHLGNDAMRAKIDEQFSDPFMRSVRNRLIRFYKEGPRGGVYERVKSRIVIV